jgi:hypothetical protein
MGPIPLAQFVITPREVMYSSSEFPRMYAQAWSVVHFLFERHPEMIEELLSGKRINVNGLDGEWMEHLKSL